MGPSADHFYHSVFARDMHSFEFDLMKGTSEVQTLPATVSFMIIFVRVYLVMNSEK